MHDFLQGFPKLVLCCTSSSDYTFLKHLILSRTEEISALIMAQHLLKIVTSIIQATLGMVYTPTPAKGHRMELGLRGLLDSG
jgi:hypothetical protein